MINDSIIFEVKALTAGLNEEHVTKMINYLKVSGCKVGLLINFSNAQTRVQADSILISAIQFICGICRACRTGSKKLR